MTKEQFYRNALAMIANRLNESDQDPKEILESIRVIAENALQPGLAEAMESMYKFFTPKEDTE